MAGFVLDKMIRRCRALLPLLLLAGCVPPYRPPAVGPASAPPNDFGLLAPPADVLPLTAQQALAQAQQLQARFDQLPAAAGDAASVDILYAAPGVTARVAGPAPVLHVVFPARVFFDFDADQPRPDADRVVRTVAQVLAQDAPGMAVTVLGHTDAIGSDAYNMDLSRRRAQAVLALLAADGLVPQALTLVAIGKRQPVAPNDTEQGRALNRRVEFLISPSVQANLNVVATRPVDPGLLSPEARAAPPQVRVYRGTQGGGTGEIEDLVLHRPEAPTDVVPDTVRPAAPRHAPPALPVARPAAPPVRPRAPAPHVPEPTPAVPLEIHPRTPEPDTSS